MHKILFFIPSLTNSAGTERISTSLANALTGRGYSVDFVVHSSDSDTFFKLRSGIKIYSLGLNGNINTHRRMAASRIRKLIKHNKYKVMINVGVACANVTMIAMPQTLGCKVIQWEHFSMKGLNLKRRIERYVSTFLCNKTIVLTNADRSAYPKMFDRKMAVIPNFTDINPQFETSPLSDKIILACGRIAAEVKGFDLLLSIWSIVHTKMPEWRLRIAGDGDASVLKKKAEELNINDSVEFLGKCDDMASEYKRCSLLAVTSRYEPFGLVIIEAMAFGVPIVSFDCPFGPREIIKNGKTGLLIENGNIEAFAKALVWLMADAQTRKKWVQRLLLIITKDGAWTKSSTNGWKS